MHPCFHMAPLGPPFGLSRFVLALFRFVCGSLWCEYGSFWSAIVAIFLVVGIMP